MKFETSPSGTKANLSIQERISKLRFIESYIVILGAVFSYSLIAFIVLINNTLVSNPIVSLDKHITDWIVAYRDPFISEIFLKITLLGSVEVVGGFSIALLIFFILKKKREYIIPFLVTIIGTSFFTYLAKAIIHRERPSEFISIVSEASFSFPSGHSSIMVALVGFVAYILIRRHMSTFANIKIVIISVLIILLVGMSRLYIGVHFLSDIFAGYLVGILWLTIGVFLVEIYIQRNSK